MVGFSKISTKMIAIIVVLALSGVAVLAGGVVYNKLYSTNTVTDKQTHVTSKFVNINRGYPNWTANASLTTGVEYTFGINITSDTEVDVQESLWLKIVPTNWWNDSCVTIWAFNVSASNWTQVPWYNFEGLAYCVVGPTGVNSHIHIPAGGSAQIDVKIRYNFANTYNLMTESSIEVV
jgi:hypothetical protein